MTGITPDQYKQARLANMAALCLMYGTLKQERAAELRARHVAEVQARRQARRKRVVSDHGQVWPNTDACAASLHVTVQAVREAIRLGHRCQGVGLRYAR